MRILSCFFPIDHFEAYKQWKVFSSLLEYALCNFHHLLTNQSTLWWYAGRKVYFPGNHKLYGLKVEVSVLQNGLAMLCSNNYPGSVSDLVMKSENQNCHLEFTNKSSTEQSLQDLGDLGEDNPNN